MRGTAISDCSLTTDDCSEPERSRNRSKSGHPISNLVFHLLALSFALILTSYTVVAQQQSLPDAPSAQRPAQQQQLPSAPQPQIPPSSPPAHSAPPPPPTADQNTPPPVTTVAPGQATQTPVSPRDELYKYVTNVNFVVIPVTVKDSSGHLVEGLTVKDFTVLEDDKQQKISFFTSDPFPLSAAVVIDEGVPDTEFAKIRNSVAALIGAFGQFDEVSIYTYGNVVSKLQDFTAVGDQLTRAAQRLKDRHGEAGGAVPVTNGPMGTSCPTINGHCIDPGADLPGRPGTGYTRTSHVLNDAVLQAARDLSRRAPDRRKIIFLISNGNESGSSASYAEVLKVLLSNMVQVYGLGIGSAALPVYKQLEKIHLPHSGYANILPKYAAATGGEVVDALSESSIEKAYSRITEDARNQYTIGYLTHSTPSSTYRSIEVQVDQPDLSVYAKYGYYPLPPGRSAPPPE